MVVRCCLPNFSRNALASENTVVVAANALSRAGLVNKGRCASDGRLIVLEENVAGARTLTPGVRRHIPKSAIVGVGEPYQRGH